MGPDGTTTRLTRLRSEAPLLLRPAPGNVVHLVGGAAGPLGGDRLRLDLVVGAGARLHLRGVAATIALAGVHADRPGTIAVRAVVGSGGWLDWAPEPTIVAGGAWLELDVEIVADVGAHVRWREEVVLGRWGEAPGRLSARTRLVVGGRTCLDHVMVAGGATGAWDGAGGLAGHRWLGTELSVGLCRPTPAAAISPEHRVASLRLADGSLVLAATAVDRRHAPACWSAPAPACAPA